MGSSDEYRMGKTPHAFSSSQRDCNIDIFYEFDKQISHIAHKYSGRF